MTGVQTASGRTAAWIGRWRAFWFPLAPLSDLAVARVLLVAIVLYLNGGLRYYGVARAPAMTWQPIALIELLGIARPTVEQMASLQHAVKWLLVAGALGIATNAALLLAFALELVLEGLLNCLGKVTHSTIPLLHAMLFLALSPCGRVWSVDAWLRHRLRLARTSEPRVSRFARWPFELLFVELAFFYFNAGLTKLVQSGVAWADGATLQYYLLEKGLPAGTWVASHPLLCSALSWAGLAFELGFPLAIVVRRLRLPFLAAGVAFHLANHVLHDVLFWPVLATFALAVPWSELRTALGLAPGEPGAQRDPLPPRRARGEPAGG